MVCSVTPGKQMPYF